MLQPESQLADEVVEVFTGDTLEEAMAYAVASLGPDLTVRRARKVRRGMQGLVGKDRYEVVAVPPARPASDSAVDNPVNSAFDALLSQAEAAELPRVRRTSRPASAATAPHPSPAVADHTGRSVDRAVEQAVERAFEQALDQTLPPVLSPPPVVEAPAQVVLDIAPEQVVAPRPRWAAAAEKAPAKAPADAPTKAPVKRAAAKKASVKGPPAVPAPSGWSRQALTDLALPAAVLDALPGQDPVEDLSWVAALASALSTVLPEPASPDEAHPLVVNGYGISGVLGLLDAATRGLTPGTITLGDRTAAATATELALAIRAAVVG
ncbi:MAG: hypothetical protein JWM02_1193 [Frankiales bacterium]|nr:hypothetical protein [Frankiales bacterium]